MARYIDADVLKRSRIKFLGSLTNFGLSNAVITLIDSIPTADVVLVKHGKWIPHPAYSDWDICTACGTGCLKRYYENGWLTEYSYAYCPHCGANMRGDK